MDEVRNPFAPGAGNPPPELAGRHDLLQRAEVVLARLQQGRHVKSFMLTGLRGVGKTVLLNRFHQMALERGLSSHMIEAPEHKPLPQLLLPALRGGLLKLHRTAGMTQAANRAMRVMAGFAKALKVKTEGVEFTLDLAPEAGVADSGDLDQDLPDLLEAVAEAAKERSTGLVLLIDELQYVAEAELGALIMGVHRISQKQLPLVLLAAGLPQLVGNMGRSKSYAERLFDFPVVDRLGRADAVLAVTEPISRENEQIAKAAVDEIVREADGYPFFLQVWGYFAWAEASKSPIKLRDVQSAKSRALNSLDASFFRVRYDRSTPAEKRYLRAMAELGAGPHRSGDIADVLGVRVSSVAPTRSSLITKGMIYAPAHGDTAFTVPLFDGFMKRAMPNLP
jgi:hypothetical protein